MPCAKSKRPKRPRSKIMLNLPSFNHSRKIFTRDFPLVDSLWLAVAFVLSRKAPQDPPLPRSPLLRFVRGSSYHIILFCGRELPRLLSNNSIAVVKIQGSNLDSFVHFLKRGIPLDQPIHRIFALSFLLNHHVYRH